MVTSIEMRILLLIKLSTNLFRNQGNSICSATQVHKRDELSAKLKMKRIVIFGQGKTGTTAMFYKVKEALAGARVFEQFEPTQYVKPAPNSDYDYSLTKALLSTDRRLDYHAYHDAHKIVYLLRDPRDWLISLLLFRMRSPQVAKRPEAREAMLTLLKRKESDPHSCSVYFMFSEFTRATEQKIETLMAWFLNLHIWLRGFENFYQHDFKIKYEDFVDLNLDALEAYLQIPLDRTPANVENVHSHVIRTKSYGGWRDWFLPADVALFQPIFANYIERNGYSNDWTLNPEPTLDPEFGSKYVERNLSRYY